MQAVVGAAAIADVGKRNPATGKPFSGGMPDFSDASTWSYIFFAGSLIIIAGLYFGFGGYKGDVAS